MTISRQALTCHAGRLMAHCAVVVLLCLFGTGFSSSSHHLVPALLDGIDGDAARLIASEARLLPQPEMSRQKTGRRISFTQDRADPELATNSPAFISPRIATGSTSPDNEPQLHGLRAAYRPQSPRAPPFFS